MPRTTTRAAAVALLSGLALAGSAEGASAQYFDLTGDTPRSTGAAHGYGTVNFSRDRQAFTLRARINDLCGPKGNNDGWRARMVATVHLADGRTSTAGWLDTTSCSADGVAIVKPNVRFKQCIASMTVRVYEEKTNQGVGTALAGNPGVASTEIRP